MIWSVLRLFGAGLLISFLGSLPVGTLNITAFHVSVTQGLNSALLFALAVVTIEIIIVRIILAGSSNLRLTSKAFLYIFPLSIVALLYLSISSFLALSNTSSPHAFQASFSLIHSPFVLGLVLSILNPLNVPFWIGWNAILLDKNYLFKSSRAYSVYLFGIALGTIASIMLFVWGGQYIVKHLNDINYSVSWIMGFTYLLFALYISYLFYCKQLKYKWVKVR